MNKKYTSILEEEKNAPTRLTTGIDGIDWLYGVNDSFYPAYPATWGLPSGKISLWAGAAGIGKSRLAKCIANKVAEETDYKVDYSFLEGNRCINLAEYIEHLKKVKPHLAILDSINQLEDFGANGSDKCIKAIIHGTPEQEGLRTIVEELGCHLIVISQLNKEGEARGSTTLPHLVDSVFEIDHLNKVAKVGFDEYKECGLYDGDLDKYSNLFIFRVGEKHRYGRTGEKFISLWGHTQEGAEYIHCECNEDPIWCETHNLVVQSHLGVEQLKEKKIVKIVEDIVNKPSKKTSWFKGMLEKVKAKKVCSC